MPNVTDDAGKVIFPIPEDGISYKDAVETLSEISDAKLYATIYDETGNEPADDVYVDICTDDHNFHRAKLIDLLESGCDDDQYAFYETNFDEDWTEERAATFHRTNRLLIRLIHAYREWKATDAVYSPDELRANPLTPL